MANKLLNINTNKLSKTQLEELVQVLSLKIEDQNRTIEFLRSTFSELESSINTLKTNFQSLQEKYDKQEILLKRKNTSIRNLQNLLYGSKSEKQDKEQDKKPTTDGVRELTLFETDEVTQERLDFLEAQQKKEDEQKASVATQRVKKKESLELS
ncbi:MAG: hypothetical protein WCR36_10070 [Bacteroidaceae bacterium]